MKKLLPLWVIIFISFFCYSSMLTMFVPLIQGSNSPLHIHYSFSALNILSGILLSLYPFGQFIGSPIIGAASDRFGRKRLLCGSLFITAICLSLCGYAIHIGSLFLLIIMCFIAGIGESNMALALSAIADLTISEIRGAAFARAWVMCSIGYITGSMFGGIAIFTGYPIVFFIEAILVLIILIVTITIFQDQQTVKQPSKLKQILLNFTTIFSSKLLKWYYAANFLTYLACFGILRVELIYMQSYFHLNQTEIAIFYSYASIIAMLSNLLLTPLLIKRTSITNIVLMSGIAATISSIIFILPDNKLYLWITTGLIGCFVPIMVAMVGTLISTKASQDNQGSVMGNNQSLQVSAEAISAIIGGVLFSINLNLPFIFFAVLNIMAIIIYRKLKCQ